MTLAATGVEGVVRMPRAAPFVFRGAAKGTHVKPLRIRINRIIDYGTIVSLIGVDSETDKPASITGRSLRFEKRGARPVSRNRSNTPATG